MNQLRSVSKKWRSVLREHCKAFCEAKRRNCPAGYCDARWSKHKFKRGQEMIGCRERRDFEKALLRLDLETWISFLSSIVKCVIQLICQSVFSSKIAAAAADMLDQMWTSARGGVRIKLHEILIEYEARVCLKLCWGLALMCDECLEIGDRASCDQS